MCTNSPFLIVNRASNVIMLGSCFFLKVNKQFYYFKSASKIQLRSGGITPSLTIQHVLEQEDLVN